VKISIVIPAFNEEKLIAETLRAIGRAREVLAARGWASELIVCDNNSTDRTAELARVAGATVVFEPVNQIARARNTGAAAATGDWLLFIDADSHPSGELFGEVIEAIQTGKYLAGGCTVRMDASSKVAALGIRLWNAISRIGKYLAGSFIFCETAAFRELGGFSQRLYASEEIEFSKRLKKFTRQRGRKLIILHHHPLVTSARKLHLYSSRQHLRFLARTILGLGGTLTDREACHIWYDGKR
jgi:glycosyltransferase involved in cell wall biosynthesis